MWHGLEAVQKFTDDPLTECPDCGGELRKVFRAPAIAFKGSGFYKTDSRASNGKSGSERRDKESTSSDSSSSSGSGSGSSGSDAGTSGSDKSSSSDSAKPSPAKESTSKESKPAQQPRPAEQPLGALVTTSGTADVAAERDRARKDYDDLLAQGLSLDLTRGKPSPAQLDLAAPLLDLRMAEAYSAADGTDCRNYGGLQGLPSPGHLLGFAAGTGRSVGRSRQLQPGADARLHRQLRARTVAPGAASGWGAPADGPVAFVCPVPGYDRHFALCQRFGIEMIPVAMTPFGPDMDQVEALVAADARIKGMWCVPKYSNPDGTVYSDETVAHLAAMETAAPDFRIFWDNAYAVHHLTDEAVEIADLLAAAEAAGHGDRVFVFGSTSKITVAGAGIAFFGGSEGNVKWYLGQAGLRTIGPDKLNQLRHARFLGDAAGVIDHMAAHRQLIAPKFAAVDRILSEELGGTGLATWTKPRGGYFVSLTVPDGCAAAVVGKAKEAGIALTPAGATHPLGVDPDDRTIRIAPTFPETSELTQALLGLTTCVRMVGFEKLAAAGG